MTGPALLVLTSVFARDRLLLMRRGIAPYRDCWAPPGGYVEAGESLESAALRELNEEVGVRLSREDLFPHGVFSLPSLNQVHVVFISVLDEPVELHPALPEATDARWFSEEEFPEGEIWGPAIGFDIRRIFERARTGRMDFYQQTDTSLRIITDDSQTVYLWRKT